MASTFSNLLYHLVFATKNRQPLIQEGLRDDLYGYMGGILRAQGGILLEIGGVPDHVHLLVKLRTDVAVSTVVQKVKAKSSKRTNEREVSPQRFEWQEGYGIFEALKSDAVFAVDTAMRLAHGVGFLASLDIQAYLSEDEPLDRLAAAGLISAEPHFDTTLVRPWPGPPRLLACRVDELPPLRVVKGGYRVVTGERLGRELVGTVGPRADLFVLYEKVEGIAAAASRPWRGAT
jgi:REP element-mobilizing transposase RayT